MIESLLIFLLVLILYSIVIFIKEIKRAEEKSDDYENKIGENIND